MKDWFNNLQPRERTILVAGAAFGALVLVFSIISGLYGSVSEGERTVQDKRELAAWLDSAVLQIAQFKGAGPSRCQAGASQSLAVIIDRTVRDAQLTQFQKDTRPAGGNNRVSVRFEAVPFDNLVGWVGTVRSSYCLAIETAAVDRGKAPGIADVRFILERPGP